MVIQVRRKNNRKSGKTANTARSFSRRVPPKKLTAAVHPEAKEDEDEVSYLNPKSDCQPFAGHLRPDRKWRGERRAGHNRGRKRWDWGKKKERWTYPTRSMRA
jgi:hypothetical protein